MKRRQFFATTCATGLVVASGRTVQAVGSSGNPWLLDFRMITVPDTQRLEAMVKQNGEVTLPTINKHGISPCGLFVADSALNSMERNYDKTYDSVIFGLTPHQNFESTLELAEKMRTDSAYLKSSAAMSQGITSRKPMFTAHERMLLRCFPDFPTIKVSSLTPNRILQLRMYRSHNFERSRAKVTQFTTKGGTIDLFTKCGIKPVFLSTTLYGSFMPSIVVLFSFESEEQMKDAWVRFVNHPSWKKLHNDPAYADTATEIINIYLKPCKGSQI